MKAFRKFCVKFGCCKVKGMVRFLIDKLISVLFCCLQERGLSGEEDEFLLVVEVRHILFCIGNQFFCKRFVTGTQSKEDAGSRSGFEIVL